MIKNLVEAIEDSGHLITYLELDGMELKLKVRRAEVIPQKETGEETPTQTQDAYIVSFTVPACDINGQHFKELNVKNESVQLLITKHGKKIFCFENQLFKSTFDKNYKEGRAFNETPLGIYLGINFKNVLQNEIKEKIESVSLLSYDNVFNEDSDDFIPYFKNGSRRIKSFKDITHWYWLNPHSGADATTFCGVDNNGNSVSTTASKAVAISAVGGVAPAFCIA